MALNISSSLAMPAFLAFVPTRFCNLRNRTSHRQRLIDSFAMSLLVPPVLLANFSSSDDIFQANILLTFVVGQCNIMNDIAERRFLWRAFRRAYVSQLRP